MRSPDAPDPQALIAALTRHLAEARVDAAAAARAREHWLRQATAEEARTAGVLLDLAERAGTVVISSVGGRSHRGRVVAVAEDFALLSTGAGPVLIRYAAMLLIRSEGAPLVGSERSTSLDLGLAEALATLASERPRVRIVGPDGTGRAGDLRSVGIDVLALRLAEDGATAHVPIDAVSEVLIVD